VKTSGKFHLACLLTALPFAALAAPKQLAVTTANPLPLARAS